VPFTIFSPQILPYCAFCRLSADVATNTAWKSNYEKKQYEHAKLEEIQNQLTAHIFQYTILTRPFN